MASNRPSSNMRWIRLTWLLVLLAHGQAVSAAAAAEDRDFSAAVKSLQAGFYERAEKEFAEFVQKNPAAEQVAEAILFQAKSRFELQKKATLDKRNFGSVVDLLSAQLPKAGQLADQYRYWMAEAWFESGNYQAAAAAYGELLKECPDSPLVLNASYGEALALYKQGDKGRTVQLLRQRDSPFQQAAQARPNDEVAARGHLLLAEALLDQQEFSAAEEVLDRLSAQTLSPEQTWQR